MAKENATHWAKTWTIGPKHVIAAIAACGQDSKWRVKGFGITGDKTDVTCRKCKKTKGFK